MIIFMKSFRLSDKKGSVSAEGTIVSIVLFGIVFSISLTTILWLLNTTIA